MLDQIKRIVLRLFPELTSGLHLDRYARVLDIHDAPGQNEKTGGGSCERFRPRYAVDLEILRPDGEKDPNFPVYEAVPLPVPTGNGMEAGFYGFPEPGTLVVVGFAYGRPDHPLVRQIYPLGMQLPELYPLEQRWQQNAATFQNVDKNGNWTRTTDQSIKDSSLKRLSEALENMDDYGRELRTIAEHSTEKIGGEKLMEAMGNLRLVSAGFANLSSGDNLNLTTASDCNMLVANDQNTTAGQNKNTTVRGNMSEGVNGNRAEAVKGSRTESVGGSKSETIGGSNTENTGGEKSVTIGGQYTEQITGAKQITAKSLQIQAQTFSIGSGSVSMLGIMLGYMDEVYKALNTIADHTHPAVNTVPKQKGTINSHADTVNGLKGKLGSISG